MPPPRYRIYGVPLSQPFRSVAWACLQKGLSFESSFIVPGGKGARGSKGPHFKKLNPAGAVPLLEEVETGFKLAERCGALYDT